MLRRISIGRHERGLLYRGRDYVRHLAPGAHWVWGFGYAARKPSTRELRFAPEDLAVLVRDPALADELLVADLKDEERAILWVDGRVTDVLGPGLSAFWKDVHQVELEVHDVRELRLEHRQLDAVLATAGGRRELLEVVVPRGARGLLYADERFQRELEPGRYAFWQRARASVQVVDLRERPLEVAGQEILTADKMSLRLNLSGAYSVRDPRVSAEAVADLHGALYRELQLALREQVGTRTLDELLAAKDAVGQAVREAVAPRARALGAELGAVGIRDVILPGEMKTLLNQVIEAEKRAQANLIARREETAATRALLNTAKLIETSPVLLRLKELEMAERIAASVDSIQVTGGLDGLLRELLGRAREPQG